MSETKPLDFTKFRERIGDLRGKDYWRSLEELSRSEVFDEFFQSEFPQQAVALSNGVDRRSFVKLMGASVALPFLDAMVAAKGAGIAPTPGAERTRFLAIEELPLALGFAVVAGGDFRRAIEDGVNSGRDTDSIAPSSRCAVVP